MAGGLIQLVAIGPQDLFVTSDPQITYFKTVYRRHTNFSTEPVQHFFTHKPNFGKRVTCVLSRNADLIRKIYLVVTLPKVPKIGERQGDCDDRCDDKYDDKCDDYNDLYGDTGCHDYETYDACKGSESSKSNDDDSDILDNLDNLDESNPCSNITTEFAWVRRIGYALIKQIDIEIGGEVIDTHYGDWLNIWDELTVQDNKDNRKIIGDVKQLTDFTNGKRMYKLFIPLQFWFNRTAGLALPSISLQYNHIKIHLEIDKLENLIKLSPTHYITVDNDFVNFKKMEYIRQSLICGDGDKCSVCHESECECNSLRDDDSTALGQFVDFDVITKRLYYIKLTKNGFKDSTNSIIGTCSRFKASVHKGSCERKNRCKPFKEELNLSDTFLLVEHIYLDSDERARFTQTKHEYLIEQLQFDGEKTVDGVHQKFKLGFTHPVKELVWITQLKAAQRINDHFNYTDSLTGNGNNITKKASLLFNGGERISEDSEYYGWVQPYQHHQNGPRHEGINVMSFALFPENNQPSGSANFTKLDDVRLKLEVDRRINKNRVAKLRTYVWSYNVFRVANGLSGLVFSRDS